MDAIGSLSSAFFDRITLPVEASITTADRADTEAGENTVLLTLLVPLVFALKFAYEVFDLSDVRNMSDGFASASR